MLCVATSHRIQGRKQGHHVLPPVMEFKEGNKDIMCCHQSWNSRKQGHHVLPPNIEFKEGNEDVMCCHQT